MSEENKSAMNVVFGAMTIGKPDCEGVRVTTLKDTAAILDIFQQHGHSEIDTARIYGQGSSEEYLGNINWQKRGLRMDTKLYPTDGRNMGYLTPDIYTHKPEDLRMGLKRSLEALKTNKLDMWYLHGPDRSVPFEVTLREVDKLHNEGFFDRFGISNYMSWEVAQMCGICEKNGWIKPTVYQGVYHVLQRSIESELFPCLRHYGMSFYAFQPIAGGFLTGRYHRDTKEFEEGSRFDPKRWQGGLIHQRYWNSFYFDALDIIRRAAKKYGLTEAECALRWLVHHSLLTKALGDAIIIGASSTAQLEQNLLDIEKNALPEEVVQALDAAWQHVRGAVPSYFH
ncbi:NADP-dependent oxidoreductase domain-containing protein [Lipomyces orientalis]|uniref:NADP-dependent oxidoreductase domain-containing protein n=1 Tax=Lipomyces orientalis TaxID=1233043 RepID=A0ACC3TVT3_9ASCO